MGVAKDGGLWSLAPRTEALHGLPGSGVRSHLQQEPNAVSLAAGGDASMLGIEELRPEWMDE
jgi:hypothetical protein